MTDGPTHAEVGSLIEEAQRVALYGSLVQALAANATAMTAQGLYDFLRLPPHERVVGYSTWLTYVAAAELGRLPRIREMARQSAGTDVTGTAGGRLADHTIGLVVDAVARAGSDESAVQSAVDAIAYRLDPDTWGIDREMYFAHYLLCAAAYVERCRIFADARTGRATYPPTSRSPHCQWVARRITNPLNPERAN